MASIVTTLRLNPEILDRIAEAAKAAGVSKSAWIVGACEARLGREGGDGAALVKVLEKAATEPKPTDLPKVREQAQRIVPDKPRMRCPMFRCNEFRPCPTHSEFK